MYRFVNLAVLLTATTYPVILTPPLSPREWFQATHESEKISSAPYISGDTFRSLAKICIDELRTPFNTDDVHAGDIIFVRSNLISYFFDHVHHLLSAPYILITHNDDTPAIGKNKSMLDDGKLIAWFALNVEIQDKHPKLIRIPIGIANTCWPFGKTEIINTVIQKLPTIEKQHLMYMNFYTEDTRASRLPIQELFAQQPWVYRRANRPWGSYLEDLASSLFVLSPHGNGLDCYRTWEALLVGSIPIVKTSSLDPLYQDLPVVIVQDWQDITHDFLMYKYLEMRDKSYKKEKIYADYWLNLIKECQQSFLTLTKINE